MARARLIDGQELHAVNDFFVGPRTHVSALYTLDFDGTSERQSSSGVIVSTGLGSTGWHRSVMTGAARLVGAEPAWEPLPWDAPLLRFTVREPFPSKTTAATLVGGEVRGDRPLRLHSHMAEHGVIFSDGVESDFLAFNSGQTATITLAERKGLLVR
jgi:hypothetical protein